MFTDVDGVRLPRRFAPRNDESEIISVSTLRAREVLPVAVGPLMTRIAGFLGILGDDGASFKVVFVGNLIKNFPTLFLDFGGNIIGE